MAATAVDSAILSGLFSDPETAALFDEEAVIRAMLEVEGALALAEADCCLIPRDAAKRIAAAAGRLAVDPAALRDGTAQDGVPVPALVALLRKATNEADAHFVHWGATSQDIVDTGLVLRLKQALDLHETRLRALCDLLAAMAETYRATPIAARTRTQQATPTSFGLKVAAWLAPLLRHIERLPTIRDRLLLVSFGGAAGNLSALGDAALDVEGHLARRLGLGVPPAPWHTARDGLIDYANWLSLVTGTLGKIGTDVALLAQNEVAELRPGAGGGSSTMPNKVNPIGAEVLISLARSNAGLIGTLHQAALHEHERSGSGWLLEWLALPQMALATGKALAEAAAMLSGLVVNADRMRATIEVSNGLMLAEAASFALAAHMPRPEAQALVKDACREALAFDIHLFDVLAKRAPAPVDWQALKDPARHMGAADAMIDRVLESHQALARQR
ncbi:3-carboxy-cis,cis-muconate cycloisomerase [Polymorphum gilvum]|uniref:3-carboxy-cis,cis-muconate cycloisomerase n=1 Tax=Polymorphum gilvum (strain LMG 25793 / CGMCC 1.9160 / SL003B-26A1) TaxID=991905 RepID=F2J585_POLGS|nr:3-carboxy-cis,cis-muconate cycloisomerase [Polymorphum gilvum]ADZ71144.1 Putative 3-carboxy-cis,cis-muconate cycloisomerase (3-carboxymuconate lactonizing enzyme) [Polymorphum gilvum SL003B-26A1]